MYKVVDISDIHRIHASGKPSLTIITTRTVVAHKYRTSLPLRVASQRQMNKPPKSKTEDLVVRIGVRKSPLKGSLSLA